jgi:oligopeptide/dipeptide ABC transporter ATP-binding protein
VTLDQAGSLHSTVLAGSESVDDPVLDVRNLRVTIHAGAREIYAVRDVSFQVKKGKTLVIVGESGSGKSVSARTLTGLLPAGSADISGSIRFNGQELVGLRERAFQDVRGPGISMVFQDPMRSLNPTMRIGTQIAESVRKHLGMNRKAATERAIELLSLVGIPHARDRVSDYPHQLSGGMRQRVMMAIAIACNPQVLIADEPTTALDVTTEAQIMELLMSLQSELDMGLILITHDMGLAFSYSDEIAVMYAGRIIEHAATKALLGHVRMPYTRGLLDSIPKATAAPHERFEAMIGRPPDPSAVLLGCAFEPRCKYAQAECKEVLPPLTAAPGDDLSDHQAACLFPLGDEA